MIEIKFKKVEGNARLPEYKSEHAAGMDLYALESETLYGENIQMIRTGVVLEMPDWVGYEYETGEQAFLYHLNAEVRSRSSMAAKGIVVANSPGTIDSDYRGEIKVLLWNTGPLPYEIVEGDRIAQLVISPILQASIVEVEELNNTARADGGFGSTGKGE